MRIVRLSGDHGDRDRRPRLEISDVRVREPSAGGRELPQPRRARILLVERERLRGALIEATLDDAEFEVVAATPRAAVAVARCGTFDVFVVDAGTGHGDAEWVARHLARSHPATPLVVLSPEPRREPRAQTVPQPFSGAELLSAVRRACGAAFSR